MTPHKTEPELELSLIGKLVATQARLKVAAELASGLLELAQLNLLVTEDEHKNYCSPEVMMIVDIAERASVDVGNVMKSLAEEMG